MNEVIASIAASNNDGHDKNSNTPILSSSQESLHSPSDVEKKKQENIETKKIIKLLDRYHASEIEKHSVRVFPASYYEIYTFSILDPLPTATSSGDDESESQHPAIVIQLASENADETKQWKLAIEQAIRENDHGKSYISGDTTLRSMSSNSTITEQASKRSNKHHHHQHNNNNINKNENEDPFILSNNGDYDDSEEEDDDIESDETNQAERINNVIDGAPVNIRETLGLASKANWKTLFVTNGLRIMCETALAEKYPCLLVGCVIPATPRKVFQLIRDPASRKYWDGLVKTINVLHQYDSHSRIEYTTYFPRWIGSFTYASQRDSLELTYWTKEEDGSYAILSQSIDDSECNIPRSSEKYTRMNVFASGFTITPVRSNNKHASETKRRKESNHIESCYLQYCCHADPGGLLGSLPRSCGISEQFLVGMMLRVIGIKECIEAEKYGEASLISLADTKTRVHAAGIDAANPNNVKDDKYAKSNEQSSNKNKISTNASQNPEDTASDSDCELEHGSFDRNSWCPSTDQFNVRGKTYLDDGVKVPSGDYMFDLFAVDLFEVDEPLDHVATRPNGVAQHFLKKQSQLANPDDAKFLFVVHFKVPGSVLYAFSLYFSSKPGVLNDESEFAHLFHDYVDGDDEFRNTRFKIIPRVIKGSYIVKKGVGTTPAILGKKIKVNHYRGQGYYEADVDLGSSSIAGGILGLVKGYATKVTIDLAFLLEGHREEELPEHIIGSIQVIEADMSKAKKLKVKS